jgi:hypothetical protein
VLRQERKEVTVRYDVERLAEIVGELNRMGAIERPRLEGAASRRPAGHARTLRARWQRREFPLTPSARGHRPRRVAAVAPYRAPGHPDLGWVVEGRVAGHSRLSLRPRLLSLAPSLLGYLSANVPTQTWGKRHRATPFY